MTIPISAKWSSNSVTFSTFDLLPDGCRDLILKLHKGQAPTWQVSPLFNQTETLDILAESQSFGFRFKPGVSIDEAGLLDLICRDNLYLDEVEDVIANFVHLDIGVEEALAGLASNVSSVAMAASRLGISSRTLQRYLIRHTDRSPSYWLRLGRVRKAARALFDSVPIIEVADHYGYSDQAHMSREFNHWFNNSPAKLRLNSDYTDQLNTSGYAL